MPPIARYVLLGVATIGLVASLGYVALGPAGAEHDAESPDADAILLARLDGSELNWNDLSGEVIILDFWATWCGPCITEIPHYNKLHDDYKDLGVHLIGVTVESGTAEDVAAFAEDESHRITYPLVMGNDEIVQAYGPVWGLPTTLLINQKGEIVKSWLGARPNKSEEIRELIDELLESD